jgi:hypothetical protein
MLHMARVALKLTPTASGGFTARIRIPEDCQDAYEKHFGVRAEARWNSNGATTTTIAEAKAREWQSEIKARISNIRAERRGEGRTLTPKQARGLAGDWYKWFTTRHLAKPRPAPQWEAYYSELYTELQGEVWKVSEVGRDPEDAPGRRTACIGSCFLAWLRSGSTGANSRTHCDEGVTT